LINAYGGVNLIVLKYILMVINVFIMVVLSLIVCHVVEKKVLPLMREVNHQEYDEFEEVYIKALL